MNISYLAMALVIASSVFYQIIQKKTPASVNPMLSLFITYMTAAILCALLFPFFKGEETLTDEFKKINWTSFALSLSVIGIEVGYLLIFRAGSSISTTSIFMSTMVVLILLPIGILFYRDRISLINALGVILCLIGVVLIKWRIVD